MPPPIILAGANLLYIFIVLVLRGLERYFGLELFLVVVALVVLEIGFACLVVHRFVVLQVLFGFLVIFGVDYL